MEEGDEPDPGDVIHLRKKKQAVETEDESAEVEN